NPYDVVVIGGGPGGYVAARRASQAGFKTALVEREHLGGVSLNWGCIPTKSLLHDAGVVDLVRQASRYGISFDNLTIDFGKAVDRSRQVVQRMQRGVQYLMTKNNVDVIQGTGSLLSANRVRVEPGGQELEARHIILATGARPRGIPGVTIDGERVMTSRHILELRELPGSLVIIGAGAIGMEFASVYSSYGVSVTVIEMEPRVLPGEDPE